MAVAFSRPLTVARQEELAALQKAQIALRGYERQEFAGIEPNNIEHQRAYLTLRTTRKRVSPQDFLKYIKSIQSSSGEGAACIQ